VKIEKVLQDYGLSEKAAKVYVALLQLGPSAVQKITQKAGLARSTVYEILEDLALDGFVNTYQKKKIKYFSAEEPSQIMRLVQNRADAIKEILPELNAMSGVSRARPSVRFYQGEEQMKIVLDEILDEASELICFGVSEDLLRILGDYHKTFLEKRIKRKISLRLILRDSSTARERQRLGPQQLRQVKIVPNKFSYHGIVYVWKNKIAMFSLANDLVAVVTESQELADLQRALFNYVWEAN